MFGGLPRLRFAWFPVAVLACREALIADRQSAMQHDTLFPFVMRVRGQAAAGGHTDQGRDAALVMIDTTGASPASTRNNDQIDLLGDFRTS